MQTIPAREIKRRGMSAVDDLVKAGPVHVIKDDRPTYVILDEAHYNELVEAQEETFRTRLAASLDDLQTGRTRRSTAQEIIDEFDLER
jgi:PHD/YefM family antitoxin component YafN of YafNO toxin-antitoxin module